MGDGTFEMATGSRDRITMAWRSKDFQMSQHFLCRTFCPIIFPLLSHIIPYYPILSHIIPYYPIIIPLLSHYYPILSLSHYYPILSHYYPILSHCRVPWCWRFRRWPAVLQAAAYVVELREVPVVIRHGLLDNIMKYPISNLYIYIYPNFMDDFPNQRF